MKKEALIEKLNSLKLRSTWDRGVREYALEIVELSGLEDFERNPLTYKALLNGATDWNEYSWHGCSLISDVDIAERLCCKSELKAVDGGRRRPNKKEDWLDVQARALRQADYMIRSEIE